jgi:hypothetical protein
MSTISSYVGDGSTKQFDITFDYAATETVKAKVDGVDTEFTFVNPSRVEFAAVPAAGAEIRIYRQTDVTLPVVDFEDGAIIRAPDLDAAIAQARRRAEELGSEVGDINSRALKFPVGDPEVILPPASDRANKFIAFLPDGTPFMSAGTGADAGFRADLASEAGGSMVKYSQNLTGSMPRTASEKFSEIVSIKDFGAIGDGIADDTAAVQAAFDSGAGAIFVPRGTYVVDMVTGSDLYVYGPGTIKKKAATKGVLLSLIGANRIEGVTLDYNWQNVDDSLPYFNNISAQQIQGSLDLVGVKFINSYLAAVYNLGASLNIDSGCSFTGGKPHNNLTGGAERPTYYVFCIADEDTENEAIKIGGAYFEGASLDPTQLHLNPTGIFITASELDGNRFRSVNINGPMLLGCSTNAGNGNVTGAIDTYNGADNIVISGATIRFSTYAGLKIQNSSYFSIIGNTITDGAVPAAAHTPHSNGIVTIEKARDSVVEQQFGVIKGNVISGCAYSGITNSCDYADISHNVINGVSTVADTATGINNTAAHVTIAHNRGTNILGVQILTDGDHVKVTGNDIDSGAGQADTALHFTGNDILIDGNSFTSGLLAGSTGIRTNGPASNVRITGNYVDNYPYGVDIRTSGGAVDNIIRGPNQIKNASIANYNLGGSVTNATLVNTGTWT